MQNEDPLLGFSFWGQVAATKCHCQTVCVQQSKPEGIQPANASQLQRRYYIDKPIFKLLGSLVKFKLCCSIRKALMMPVLFPIGTSTLL